jgi:molecular chaperone DnaK
MGKNVGIDFGTTNSAIAFMDGDVPKIIPNDRGNRITPSVVAFSPEGEVMVGEAAKNQAVVNAERTVLAVKRQMGENRSFTIGNHLYSPEELASYILKKLKTDAEQYLGQVVENAVITVPAYFTENQRRAIKKAGSLAGLTVKKIINEPTAAALAYGYGKDDSSTILVYDLGGGTFDVTCLKKEGGVFNVKASSGNNTLGGIDFDDRILQKVVKRFNKESNSDCKSDPMLMQQLKEQVERAKIEISSRETTLIALPFIGGQGKPVHLTYELRREDFSTLINDLVFTTLECTRKTLKEAGLTTEDLDTLILAGGSSRIPLIQSSLEKELSLIPEHRVNPDEIVALGAAVQASLIEEKNEKVVLNDVTPFSLGVEIEKGKYMRVLRKNTRIPAQEKMVFTTIADNQASVEIHVLQGEKKTALENVSLGRFLLSGIRKGKKGEPHIEVQFSIDSDGILNVTARDKDTRVEQKVTIAGSENEDNPGNIGSDEQALKERLASLLSRIDSMVGRAGPAVDMAFREEIDEIRGKTKKAIKDNNRSSMRECQIALETLIGELDILGEEEGLGYGRQA